jgi:dynein intermediate chain 2
MIHLEGGWPKDVDTTEVESKNRYIKKVTNTESYTQTVTQLASPMIQFLKQNISLDIYEDYFGADDIDFVSEPPSAKTVTVFKDPSEKYKRAAVHTSWFPVDGKKIAVAYAFLEFQQMPEGADVDSYIWDVSNPNLPDSKLSPASPLLCIEYNPRENNTLVGGSYNGVICL